MSMLSSVLATTGWAARKTLIAGSLAFIGLVVGVGCVLLPAGVPFGIVGLAGLLLLWVLPDLQSVPSRLARRSFLPMLFTTLSVPFYLAIVIPGVPLISFRRLILFFFVGTILITICASSKHRETLMSRLKATPALFYVVAGYYGLLVITLPVSHSSSTTANGIVQSTMAWFLPLVAVVMFVEKFDDVVRVFKVLILSLSFDFIIGAIETHLQRPLLWQLLPSGTRAYILANYPLYAGMETGNFRNGVYRAISAYTISLSWGEMVAMVSPVAAYFIAHGRSGWGRLLGTLALLMCILSMILTGSRGAYVSSIGALCVYVLLWAIRQVRLHPEGLFGAIALFLGGIAVSVVLAAITFVNKFHIMVFGNGQTQASNAGRDAEWAAAMPKIYESPVWGHGFSTAGDVVNFMTGYGQGSLDDGRINLLIDSGILGFGLFFGTIAVAIFVCFKIYVTDKSAIGETGATIGCGLIAYTIFRTGLSQTDNNTLMYVFVGLSFALNRLCRTQSRTAESTMLAVSER